MFLRSSVVKKGGKTYRYWKLVENVRADAGPRQQVVAHLGDLANFTATDWRGIQLGTICLRKADGMKLELERVSTPRPEEA